MINVFQGGIRGFEAAVYGDQHQANLNYFQNQLSNIGNSLTEMGQRFFEGARTLYEEFNSDRALRLARAAIRQVRGTYIADIIQPFTEIGEFQAAPPTMQRWIMANPVVREAYHAQRCDGYSDTYVDMYPKDIGRSHYDYRRVMDGMVVEDGDDYYVDYFPDELVDGDKDLDLIQKSHILSTWKMVEMYMNANGEDPTSVWNSSL